MSNAEHWSCNISQCMRQVRPSQRKLGQIRWAGADETVARWAEERKRQTKRKLFSMNVAKRIDNSTTTAAAAHTIHIVCVCLIHIVYPSCIRSDFIDNNNNYNDNKYNNENQHNNKLRLAHFRCAPCVFGVLCVRFIYYSALALSLDSSEKYRRFVGSFRSVGYGCLA